MFNRNHRLSLIRNAYGRERNLPEGLVQMSKRSGWAWDSAFIESSKSGRSCWPWHHSLSHKELESCRWTWVWVNSGRWWWTGRPGMLRFMGSQRVGYDWTTEVNWTELKGSGTIWSEERGCWGDTMWKRRKCRKLIFLHITARSSKHL